MLNIRLLPRLPRSFFLDYLSNRLPKRLKRTPGRIKSTFLRLPIIQSRVQRLYERRLAAFADAMPQLCAAGTDIVASINREGAVLTSLDQLPFCPELSLRNSIDRLLPDLQGNNSDQENSIRLSQENLMKHPDIVVWGLHEKLLDVVENCLGLPAYYHRVEVRRDLVNKNNPTPASQWHRDVVDHKTFKIILYFNDVDADGGPFEFIPKPITLAASRAMKYNSGYLAEDVMEAAAPRHYWRLCTGQAGSMIVGDTVAIFHRIRAPVSNHRLSATFTYTSRQPIHLYDKMKNIAALSQHLTERQRRCLLLD